jgi:dipeptidyl aminopeptidase/acylaminoacyl peptidase
VIQSRTRPTDFIVFALTWLAALTLSALAVAQPVAEPDPQPDFLPLPPALHADGMPEIPATIAQRVARYSDFRPTVLAGWHPRRHAALALAQAREIAQVYELATPGGQLQQLTRATERIGDAMWPREADDYFVYVSDRDGDESWQIYRQDVADATVTLLTDGGPSQNLLGTWSHRNDRLAFGSTRRNGIDRDIYVMDPRNPASTRLLLEVTGSGWNPLDWSPDDSRLAVLQYVSAVESFIWSVDLETGVKTAVTRLPAATATVSGSMAWSSYQRRGRASGTSGEAKPDDSRIRVSYAGAQWSNDGRGIYTATDRESEFKRLAYIDLGSGRHTYLTSHLPWDVEEFAVSNDGRWIAFTTNENGVSVLRLLDTESRAELPRPKMSVKGVINDLTWHPDGQLLGFTVNTSSTPSDIYGLDMETGRLQRWTAARTAANETDEFPDPEFVTWKGAGGVDIPALLYRPPPRFAGKRPVLALIHGGPEGQARPGFLGNANFFLLEMGVALLMPNVRGSTGYGKSFVALDDGRQRENAVEDLGAMLDWIDEQDSLDGSRVMLTGGSYGGYLTLAAAARYSRRVRCAMSIAGISDFVTFLKSTGDYRRDFRRVEYGDERERSTRRYLRKISPLNNAREIKSPLFIVHGRNDPRVPYTEAEQLVRTVRKNDVPVWYLLGDDEGHGFARKTNQDYQFYATIAFMQTYLLN